jgi:catechol 2,3-dioxygenase-like lactoylglutathione lyase family enzyme
VNIRGIDFVAYLVSDLDRAVDFYQNTLGLKLDSKFENVYAEFDVAGTAFGLYKEGEGPAHPYGMVAFNVPSLAEAVAELKAGGIECVAVEDSPVCRMGFFTDPDGNEFMLHEKPKAE